MTSLPIPSAGMRPILRDFLAVDEKARTGALNMVVVIVVVVCVELELQVFFWALEFGRLPSMTEMFSRVYKNRGRMSVSVPTPCHCQRLSSQTTSTYTGSTDNVCFYKLIAMKGPSWMCEI